MTRPKKAHAKHENETEAQPIELDPSEYSEQPDSGSRIGGHRGENEYGVSGELVRDSSHSIFREMNAPKSSLDIEPSDEPLPFGELQPGFPGISEWSAQRAGLEESEEPDEQELALDRSYRILQQAETKRGG